MEANEAPKKIYISLIPSISGGHVYTTVNKDFPNAIEYTRTDAFIEKAAKWIEEHEGMYEAFDTDSRTYYTDIETMIEDFINDMKGD